MTRQRLVVGTRNSPLARTQTDLVIQLLHERYPEPLEIEVRPISTEGDRSQPAETPLQQLAGQGIFVKELERALLDGTIDIAVHSLKDMTTAAEAGLVVAAIPLREDPRDVLIAREGATLSQLPLNARVGSSSLRRAAQLAQPRPDLSFAPIRGNVDTRARKVAQGDYDATILAAAGLLRLGLQGLITEYFSPQVCLPDPGQGALAVQVRADDTSTLDLVSALDDAPSRAAITAERAFLEALGGGCQTPVGALATQEGATLTLQGMIATPNGSGLIRSTVVGAADAPDALGRELAGKLLALGAGRFLAEAQEDAHG